MPYDFLQYKGLGGKCSGNEKVVKQGEDLFLLSGYLYVFQKKGIHALGA
ncbi:hypothetical protein QOZ95_003788 [Paenibacillus brasilensis]|uniref:Uncharacterized protein n=1 Tax=Paenibacillus brasilensis TaxID=128574 RepID=A0ABU0L1P2_9BACL|nr:hypothetical protein [Paenibacillus brasilensis]